MATFIGLLNWTDQGIRNFGDSLKRAQAFSDTIEGMGGKVTGLWWTVGPYDLVSVIEAPDEETATAAMLKTGALGNVRSTTLRGYSAEEFGPIIDRAR
ncbi:MAG: GYD domain-containing protein [Actinomycetota bacterium]